MRQTQHRLALLIMANQMIGEQRNLMTITKGMGQFITSNRGIILPTKTLIKLLDNKARFRASELINGLIRVANHHHRTMAAV